MFAGMNYLYAGFRGYDVTGDRSLFGAGLTAADAMADLYLDHARMIPIGDYRIEGPEEQFDLSESHGDLLSGSLVPAVDSIYTAVPILWRAYEETSDPRFRDVAVSHADRHLDWCIKPDGSTWHEVGIDPETGDLIEQYNDLAYSDETCWSRGQGWNVAGLVRAYDETKADCYLTALESTVGYYVDNSPGDLVPYWDFKDPAIPDAPRDTSAVSLTAYGLARLDPTDDQMADLRETGQAILSSLLEEYLVTEGDRRGMVLHGCYNKPGNYATDHKLIWTDYYVAATLFDLLEG